MAKTLTIQIKSVGEALEGFLLTRNRLALLKVIRTQRPGSIYELAKALKRAAGRS